MAELIPDPSDRTIKGAALKSARDALQERVLTDTFWCCYCCYGGCGVDGMDLPCCFSTGEICCCGGTTKITACYDQDGCVALSNKCCCSLVGCECPPDNTPGIGCCGARCLSNLEDRKMEDITSVAAKNELETYQKTFWCWSCYCCFQGLSYDCSPLCQSEGKCCCLWVSLESASCCDDGWIELSAKSCCMVIDCSVPAGYTPGVVCCGATLCCANMPGQQVME